MREFENITVHSGGNEVEIPFHVKRDISKLLSEFYAAQKAKELQRKCFDKWRTMRGDFDD